jgi:two-component sensor histidine kinase
MQAPMTTAEYNYIFLGHSDTAAAIRRFPWATNPLGPIEEWSHSLRTMTGVILNSAFPHCIVWGPRRITVHNDAFVPILGQKSALGRPFDEVWREAWYLLEPMVDRAYAGEATFIEDYPLVIERCGYAEQAYFTFCYSPVRDDDGQVAGMVDTVIETTTKVCAEKHALLVNTELAHRIQNTLTIVAAVVDQTFRSEIVSIDQARAVLIRRIAALGHAHDVLTQSSWSSAPMDAVIDNALAPHRHAPGQIDAQGPPLSLSATQALTLAMAIHELCTNATKYGALSVAGGRVTVRWYIAAAAEDCLHLTWTETGGPAVAEPKRRGFGSRLIEGSLADDFRGQVKVTYAPQGLHLELIAEMRNLGSGA